MHNAPTVYYVHGFNSSPQSHKAQVLARAMESLGLIDHYRVPALSYDPKRNIQLLESCIEKSLSAKSVKSNRVRSGSVQSELTNPEATSDVVLVGSSMGGFYSAYLSQKYGLKAALINPVVNARELLKEYLGELTNDYTGERYQLEEKDLDEYQRLVMNSLPQPEKLLLVVQMEDEVLDSHIAVDHYAQCKSIIEPGGSHRFDDFEKVVPRLFEFLELTKMV